MNKGTVSFRYAKALLKFAIDRGLEEQVNKEVKQLSDSFLKYRALRRVLSDPMVSVNDKKHVILACAGGDVSKEFTKFIELIIKECREDYLQTICLTYSTLYCDEKKILNVKVVSAIPLEQELLSKMRQAIGQATQMDVRVNNFIDKDIIGGYVIYYDTYMLDCSVVSRLKWIGEELKSGYSVDYREN